VKGEVDGIQSYRKFPVLAKWKMFTHLSCLLLAEQASKNGMAQTRISTREYHNIFVDFDPVSIWKYFQDYYRKSKKKLSELCKTKVTTSVAVKIK
jgi:hypothetical protein